MASKVRGDSRFQGIRGSSDFVDFNGSRAFEVCVTSMVRGHSRFVYDFNGSRVRWFVTSIVREYSIVLETSRVDFDGSRVR